MLEVLVDSIHRGCVGAVARPFRQRTSLAVAKAPGTLEVYRARGLHARGLDNVLPEAVHRSLARTFLFQCGRHQAEGLRPASDVVLDDDDDVGCRGRTPTRPTLSRRPGKPAAHARKSGLLGGTMNTPGRCARV